MAGKIRYTDDMIAQALTETKGMIYVAAKRLTCAPETIYARLKRSERLRALQDALQGEMGDVAELRLYNAIQRGEHWAIAFYLRTKGKSRGYIERKEISGIDGGPIHSIREIETIRTVSDRQQETDG